MKKFLSSVFPKTFLLVVLLGCLSTVITDSLTAEADYTVDPKRSFVEVSVHYAVIPTLRGRFTDFQGTIHFDPRRTQDNSVKMSIKTKSIATGNKIWDRIIRSRRLLNHQKYPMMTFQSRSVEKVKDGYSVIGTVNLHGVTKEIKFPFHVVKRGKLSNQEYLIAQGLWVLNRKDFEIIWNSTLDRGGVVVGDEVRVDWKIFALRPS